jgi:hypothetical protein
METWSRSVGRPLRSIQHHFLDHGGSKHAGHTFNCPPSIASGHTPLVVIGLHVICSGAATSISREDSIEPIQLLQWHQNSPRTQHRQHPPPQHFPVDPGNILKAKGVPQFPYPPTHRGSNHRNGRLTVWGTPFFFAAALFFFTAGKACRG